MSTESKYKNKVTVQDREFLPTVFLTDEKGLSVEGTYLSKETLDIKGKPKTIYTLAIIDTKAPIRIKKDDDYEDVNVNVGDRVSLFGNVVLDRLMSKIEVGTDIEITFDGKQKNQRSEGSTNLFTVRY